MLKVPSVTMNGGSLMAVTSQPFRRPNPMPTRRPTKIASTGSMPDRMVSPVIITVDRAMIQEHERSIPAVRMISV